jgi:ribosomal protein L14
MLFLWPFSQRILKNNLFVPESEAFFLADNAGVIVNPKGEMKGTQLILVCNP